MRCDRRRSGKPGAPLPLSLVVVWMTGAPLLLAVQLGASGALERAALERAGELLERRVAEQAARWRAVSELSSDFSFACRLAPGRNLVCEWFSDAFSQITGYAPEEIEGQGWRALFADEQRAALLRRHEQCRGIAREVMQPHLGGAEVRRVAVRCGAAHGTAISAAATRRRSPIMML